MVSKEDVSRLEIPVNDSFSVDVVVAVDDLVHEGDGFVFWNTATAGDEFGQITTITELGNNVCVIFGVIDVINFYDVFAVLEGFEYLDLGGE